MKVCSVCKTEKANEEFLKNKRSSDGLGYRCKECRSEQGRQAYANKVESGSLKEYQTRNKEKISEANKEYQRKHTSSEHKQNRKLKMCQYKGGECVSCGLTANEYNVDAFDFHHLDPAEKEKGLSSMVMGKWSKITAELDKCVLLCSNCHRIHHHGKTVDDFITGWDDL